MIINGPALLEHAPIYRMLDKKVRHQETNLSYGLTELGYDVRIRETVIFYPGRWYNLWRPTTVVIPSDPAHLPRVSRNSRFALASTLEMFRVPATMMAMVRDKSSWARNALSLFNTTINPGQRGFITLELAFHGNEPIEIPAGTPIAQIHFQKVGTPAHYEGRFQDQPPQPVAP